MTLDEVERLLPNGFHDARLDSLLIDYWGHKAIIEFEAWAVTDWTTPGRMPELYQRARLTLTGLIACAVDVPNGEWQTEDACTLWIDMAPAEAERSRGPSWPSEPLPAGAFQRTFYFMNDGASYIHMAAKDAQLEWLSEVRLFDKNDPWQ